MSKGDNRPPELEQSGLSKGSVMSGRWSTSARADIKGLSAPLAPAVGRHRCSQNEIYQLFGLFAANFHSIRTQLDLWPADDSWLNLGLDFHTKSPSTPPVFIQG